MKTVFDWRLCIATMYYNKSREVKRMKKFAILFCILAMIISGNLFAQQPQIPVEPVAPGLEMVDQYTIVGEKHLINDYEPLYADGDVNVIVEIPTGTTAKWEITPEDGALRWEFKKGKPRIVKYLGYPGNYGSIPRTLLPKELGGDGDPLDVIVIGPSVPRGTVLKAKLIGVLKMWDGGEQDDKLIAIMAESPLYEANNMKELDEKFPGVSQIIEIWFSSYKGPGEIETRGYGDSLEARQVLDASIKTFQEFVITQ